MWKFPASQHSGAPAAQAETTKEHREGPEANYKRKYEPNFRLVPIMDVRDCIKHGGGHTTGSGIAC